MSIVCEAACLPAETSAKECQSDRAWRLMRPKLPAFDSPGNAISKIVGDGTWQCTRTFRTVNQGARTRAVITTVSQDSGLLNAESKRGCPPPGSVVCVL